MALGLALVARLGLRGSLATATFSFAWQAWHLATSTVHSAWQAWHLWHWTGSGGALGSPVGAVVAAAVCVAGVALGDIDRHFAWQAWHLVTSTVTLRGRRGTYGTDLHWLWQAWHLAISTIRLATVLSPWLCVVDV